MAKKTKEKGKYRVIELNGTGGFVTTIDEADWDKVKDYTWYAKLIPKYRGKYHAMSHAYNEYGKQTTVSLHRLIMDAPQHLQVDHINADSLDNRRENLRLCTQSQNRANMRAPVKNKTGYRGVYMMNDKFCSKVGYKGRVVYCGTFNTPQEAARAYDRKKLELYGEFAWTNRMERYYTDEEKKVAKDLKITPEELISE